MDLILLVPIILWAIGGWITGLLIKSAGIKLKGGYIFLMFLGWGVAGLIGLIAWSVLSDGSFYENPGATTMYGLVVGMIGGLITVRQLAKARKKRSKQ
jgi:hypothetical protein